MAEKTTSENPIKVWSYEELVQLRNVISDKEIDSSFINKTSKIDGKPATGFSTVVDDGVPPVNPTELTTTAGIQFIFLQWTYNTETDMSHYEIWRNTTDDNATATKIAQTKANVFADESVAAGTAYFYWIKAVDHLGNVSGFNTTAGSSATPRNVGTTDVDDNTITAPKINVINLAAINADLGNIIAGTITMPSTGFIRGGQTAYNTGRGFFLGHDVTDYKFSLGNPTGDRLTWNGAVLDIRGQLNADDIISGTITGRTVQTAISGKRLKMHYVPADFAGYLDYMFDNHILARIKAVSLFPSAGGIQIELAEANRISGEINEMDVSWSGNSLYPGNAWFRLRNRYCGLYYDNASGRTDFIMNANFRNSIIPSSNNLFIGFSTDRWRWIHAVDIDISGDLFVGGNVDSNLVPRTSRDLGTSANRWRHLWLSSQLNVGGNTFIQGDTVTRRVYPDGNFTRNLGLSSRNWGKLYFDSWHRGTTVIADAGATDVWFHQHILPNTAGVMNLGSATLFWEDINYKNLIDRGCLGDFSEKVELSNKNKVSCIKALQSIKKHPKLKTKYKVSRLDYSTMPKAVYEPAPIAKKDIYDEKNKKKLLYKKGQKIGKDGAELGALVSIMIGAIKELDKKVEKLEKKLK